jgi:competence protein ComEA
VYIAGEVVKPGLYSLPPGRRANDVLALAGGPKPGADLVAVNLAARVADGDEIVVPKIGSESPRARRSAGPRAHAPHAHARRKRATPPAAPAPSIDLNTADESTLEALPGIGPGLARRIVEYREANGPFASVDELADVSGITPRLQDELADAVVIR